MSERCQNKFTENFDIQNNIIYVGFIVGTLAVLYFYRFHFATIAFSYVVGCVACYYVLKSRILFDYIKHLKYQFCKDVETNQENPLTKGCETCGSRECLRHDSSITTDPWTGLQIHKQLDQAIEDFYNTILDQFITSWYCKVTLQPFFVDELRQQLRYASACLLRRAIKINYSSLITSRLVPCALHHYMLCAEFPDRMPLLDSKMAVHPAAANRKAELKYLRAITNAIMPYLLKNNELNNDVFSVLIREIFSNWVLLPLADVLCEPYLLNALVLLVAERETHELPATPNYSVEFLETFVRQTDSLYVQRSKMLRIDLDYVINDQEHFYAFMQYLKTTSHIRLLQFYKDIKTFQTKILNPELSVHELAYLHSEACDMYRRYFDTDDVSPSLKPLADELKEMMNDKFDSVKKLQTSRALYQAARQSHTELEKVMLPKFLHSEEFYKVLIGSRIHTGYHKQMTKKPQEKLLQTALKLGTKLKGALRTQTIDGQVLDCFTNADSEEESVDNMHILQYLDSVTSDDALREQDLRTYKVVLTNVDTRLQAPPRRGSVRVFTCAVHRATGGAGPGGGAALGGGATAGGGAARLWTLERSEHDFHLLRSKMHEFHGDQLLHDLPLPSRRDNSPLETLRYKYEDFIQRLLQKSLLQTSELLHLFLTVDGDFSMVVQASTLNANSTDLANIYQSVTHKLRKEKGQHLESFLKNLLISSDMERYQALKQGTSHIEEAQEMSEDIDEKQLLIKHENLVRNIFGSIFENNFGIDPVIDISSRQCQNAVVGFTQCSMFILIKIIKVSGIVSGVIGTLLSITREFLDDVFNIVLNRTLCDLLNQRRLAHLIRLGHGLLFGKKSIARNDPNHQRETARKILLESIPTSATVVLGSGLPSAVNKAFQILQNPHLNKQLFYNLLDLCLLELFPELSPPEK